MPVVFKVEWIEQDGHRVGVCADCRQVTLVAPVVIGQIALRRSRGARAGDGMPMPMPPMPPPPPPMPPVHGA